MRQLSIIAHDNNSAESSNHNYKNNNNSSPIHRNPIETIHYNSIDETEVAKIHSNIKNNTNRQSFNNEQKQLNKKKSNN
jgi:hypothetical protein